MNAGAATCHLAYLQSHALLLAANYGGGEHIIAYKISSSGELEDCPKTYTHEEVRRVAETIHKDMLRDRFACGVFENVCQGYLPFAYAACKRMEARLYSIDRENHILTDYFQPLEALYTYAT